MGTYVSPLTSTAMALISPERMKGVVSCVLVLLLLETGWPLPVDADFPAVPTTDATTDSAVIPTTAATTDTPAVPNTDLTTVSTASEAKSSSGDDDYDDEFDDEFEDDVDVQNAYDDRHDLEYVDNYDEKIDDEYGDDYDAGNIRNITANGYNVYGEEDEDGYGEDNDYTNEPDLQSKNGTDAENKQTDYNDYVEDFDEDYEEEHGEEYDYDNDAANIRNAT